MNQVEKLNIFTILLDRTHLSSYTKDILNLGAITLQISNIWPTETEQIRLGRGRFTILFQSVENLHGI
ncbi:hypothetical protein VTL71DRAFT_10933 [Oculimacula yallundae]|uniref:Uncharacterized protein n=1 Tax=Oculimacula yallundae TaxID=86028 RepID=A0ABR4CVJ7_9HELO